MKILANEQIRTVAAVCYAIITGQIATAIFILMTCEMSYSVSNVISLIMLVIYLISTIFAGTVSVLKFSENDKDNKLYKRNVAGWTSSIIIGGGFYMAYFYSFMSSSVDSITSAPWIIVAMILSMVNVYCGLGARIFTLKHNDDI